MKRRFLPPLPLFLTLYLVLCAGLAFLLILLHLPESILFFLMVLVVLAAINYPRAVSFGMLVALAAAAIWVAYYTSVNLTVSLLSISVISISATFIIFMVLLLITHRNETVERLHVVADYTYAFELWRNPDGSFAYISPSCERVTGYTPEEFIQKPQLFTDIILPNDRKALAGDPKKLGDTVEFRITHRDGSERWLQYIYRKMYSQDGHYLGIRASVMDITDQKLDKEALVKSTERLTLAMEGTEDGLWDIDLTTDALYLSPTYQKTLGFNPDQSEIKVEDLLKLIHPDDLDAMIGAFQAHLRMDTPSYQAEYRLSNWRGEWKWVLDRGKVIYRSPKGKPIRMIGTHVDISARKKVEESLAQSEQKFRELAENMHEVFWLRELPSGKFIYISPAFEQVWGRPADSLYQNSNAFAGTIHREDLERVYRSQKALLEQQKVFNEEFRIIHPDLSERWVSVREYPIRDSDGQYYRSTGIAEDITEREGVYSKLRASERRYRDLIERQGGGVGIIDREETIVYVNPAGENIFGVPRGSLAGKKLREFLDEDQQEEARIQQEMHRRGVEGSYELVIKHPDGEKRHLLITATPRLGTKNQFLGTIIVFRDITQRKLSEERLRFISLHDALTGLNNRANFDAEMARFNQSPDIYPVSIIMVDVDNLKLANDKFGHHIGDNLIVRAANVLKNSLRAGDTIARYGGDEFVVLLPNADASVLERAMSRIEEHVTADNAGRNTFPEAGKSISPDAEGNSLPEAADHIPVEVQFPLSLSTGGAVCTDAGTLQQALEQADAAMYRVKSEKKGRK